MSVPAPWPSTKEPVKQTPRQSASQDEPRPLEGGLAHWKVNGAWGVVLHECFTLAPSHAPEVTNDSHFRLPSGRSCETFVCSATWAVNHQPTTTPSSHSAPPSPCFSSRLFRSPSAKGAFRARKATARGFFLLVRTIFLLERWPSKRSKNK